MKVNDILANNITNLYGAKGQAWLDKLPIFLNKIILIFV
jgi:hypothetical protein